MATYDRNALRLLSPEGIRGGVGGRGANRALDRFWVDKVTVDVDLLNVNLSTDIAAGDIITFSEITREQVLLQGGLLVHTASTAAATLDIGTSTGLDDILDGQSIAATGHTPMVASTETPQLFTPADGRIAFEFKTGTAAGAVFVIWWAWLDVDVDDKFLAAG